MNQLIVTLIVILLPGIIACVIYDKIAEHSKWTSFQFGLYVILLGTVSYVVLQLLKLILFYVGIAENLHLDIWGVESHSDFRVPYIEVICAAIIAPFIAFSASALIHHKLLNNIVRKLNISSKYGDENLFSYYLNSKEIDWVYVRDIENSLTYRGRVNHYSETETMQEIVLSEVTVFDYEDAKQLYEVSSVYITKSVGQFIIEALPISDKEV